MKDVEIDTDAKTRRQSKEIKKLTTVPKKSPLKKNRTMNATVKVIFNLRFSLVVFLNDHFNIDIETF